MYCSSHVISHVVGVQERLAGNQAEKKEGKCCTK